MTQLTPYKILAALVACLLALGLSFSSGWYVNGLRHENAALKASSSARAAFDKEMAKEQVRAAGLDAQIRELLAREPAVKTVREVIRANPSACVRPAAVTDSLRTEVASANQAIAASRGDKAVSADSPKASQPDG